MRYLWADFSAAQLAPLFHPSSCINVAVVVRFESAVPADRPVDSAGQAVGKQAFGDGRGCGRGSAFARPP